ncbi:MAG: hypothetical protein GY717_03570 [Rhodobacteraceae bacterium]|nr:hypothetical protein [Paracoccaceae bacterium]
MRAKARCSGSSEAMAGRARGLGVLDVEGEAGRHSPHQRQVAVPEIGAVRGALVFDAGVVGVPCGAVSCMGLPETLVQRLNFARSFGILKAQSLCDGPRDRPSEAADEAAV